MSSEFEADDGHCEDGDAEIDDRSIERSNTGKIE
jgi:hypothetical protein